MTLIECERGHFIFISWPSNPRLILVYRYMGCVVQYCSGKKMRINGNRRQQYDYIIMKYDKQQLGISVEYIHWKQNEHKTLHKHTKLSQCFTILGHWTSSSSFFASGRSGLMCVRFPNHLTRMLSSYSS